MEIVAIVLSAMGALGLCLGCCCVAAGDSDDEEEYLTNDRPRHHSQLRWRPIRFGRFGATKV